MRRQAASLTHRSTSFFSTLLLRPAPAPTPIPNPHSAQVPMESSVEEERYCYNPKLTWNPQVEQYFIKAYGAEHFARISKALTYPSCYSCIRVNTLKSTTDAVIEKLLKVLQEAELGYSNDISDSSKNEFIVSEVTQEENNFLKVSSGHQNSRNPTEAENNLVEKSLQGKFISKCCVPGLDYVVFVRGSGPRAIRYDAHECTGPAKEVIVSRKCAEAVLRGAQVYVPGVLACSANVEKGDIVSVSVAVEQHGPDGKWGVGMTRGIVLQGLQTDPYFIQRNGLYIGQGRTMLSRAGMFRVLEGIAIDMHNRVFKLPSFNGLLEGEIFLQNLPSIITAHALDPQKGERILDMCAAPGGKTTAIAMLMKDDGEVVAADRSHNKVMDIQKLAIELGLKCITTYKLDALKSVQMRTEFNQMKAEDCNKDTTDTTIPGGQMLTLPEEIVSSMSNGCCTTDFPVKENIGNGKVNGEAYTSKADIRKAMRRMRNGPGRNQIQGGKVENSKGFLPGSFDRVLLDAPCSALGLRPRLFTGEETLESLRKHATYQRRMFDQAVQLVRAGGVIVYSTCTINPGENEALVRYALDRYKFLALAPQSPKIGGPGIIGTCKDVDGYTEEWLRPGEEDLVQRFDPSSSLDTIGFFIAKFSVGEKDTRL